MRVEAESVREALSLAIENFKNFEEFKEKILEGRYASYCVRYEDGQNTIKKLYLNFDLSSIIPPDSRDEAAEEDAAPIEDDASTAPEAVPVANATSEQGDEDNDWWSV